MGPSMENAPVIGIASDGPVVQQAPEAPPENPFERAVQALVWRIGGQMNDRLDDAATEWWLRDTVRTVLQAIREPSEGMVEAGAYQVPCAQGAEEGPPNLSAARECYTAMIDAALEEG
jgi:hypothetical protein